MFIKLNNIPFRLEADAETSTPKRRASTSPMPSSSPDEDIKPKIKQEHMDTSGSPEDQKKSRTEVADAESNTMHSGKSLTFPIWYISILPLIYFSVSNIGDLKQNIRKFKHY